MPNEITDPSETSSGNGHGTYTGPEEGQETIDRPVLDGATETETSNVNPRYGMADPGLIRHPETGEKTPIPDEKA